MCLLVPPFSHITTSLKHIYSRSPFVRRFPYTSSPDHLTNITPVLTSFVSLAGTWPTLPTPSPVSTLLHQPCRYLASPFPLTLCQSIHAALLGCFPFASIWVSLSGRVCCELPACLLFFMKVFLQYHLVHTCMGVSVDKAFSVYFDLPFTHKCLLRSL